MRRVRRIAAAALLPVLALLAGMPGCGPRATTKPAASDAEHTAYAAEIDAWHARRERSLASDTGWLTVAGLFWLVPGDNTFGTDPACDIVLPAGSASARAGTFVHRDGATTVRAFPGTVLRWRDRGIDSLRMRSDAADTTDVVELGRLRFFVIERGGRAAIRMRDLENPARRAFHGIERYPVDPAWRVEARLEPYVPPRRVPIASVIGTVDSMECPGALVFELGGRTYRLDPILESPEATSLFILFSDSTSGDETYGAGRFLYADRPAGGKTILDFNKAYNPPCAFTPFATCPLPPPQNDLPVAVRAGEKDYGGH